MRIFAGVALVVCACALLVVFYIFDTIARTR